MCLYWIYIGTACMLFNSPQMAYNNLKISNSWLIIIKIIITLIWIIPASGQFLKVWKKLLSTLENALQSLFNQASMLSVSCPLYLLW